MSEFSFSLETIVDDQMFSVYLGNIPADVILEDVWINGKQLKMSEKLSSNISPIVHSNGSQAYELRLPFEDPIVQQTVREGLPYRELAPELLVHL